MKKKDREEDNLREDCQQAVSTRVEELLSRMTLEEKVAQLGSVMPEELLEGEEFSPEKAEEFLSEGIGQITRAGGSTGLKPKDAAQLANDIQQFLEEETRLGVPATMHEECLSGYMGAGGTTYPQAIGLASSWEPELVENITKEIRKQLKAIGAHHALSPVLDVARDLRWGRLEETFGEDPYLVAKMAIGYVEGLQGENPREGIDATLKHFGGHSAGEGGRNHAPVNLSPRELREKFLFPFEAAVKEGDARSVMNAYHDIDGVPCAASRQLLTDILREEWGFQGVVVSDYFSIRMLHTAHYVAEDEKEAGALALEAGLDVELPATECYGENLIAAIKEGLVTEAALDEAVSRQLRAKMEKGIFSERRYVDPDGVDDVFETEEQRELALEAARKSPVLLKNEGDLLPLGQEVKKLAVVGPNAAETKSLLGDYAYSVHVESEEDTIPVVTVLEGIENAAGEDVEIRYAQGCEIRGEDRSGFEEARAAAEWADATIAVVGGKSGLGLAGEPGEQKQGYLHTTGEGSDRTDLKLPGVQQELLQAIFQTGTPTAAVLVNGRPLAIDWAADNLPAILEAWLPGEEGGNAVGEILFGRINPGGKLPVSIPRSVGETPVHYNRKPISAEREYVFSKNEPLFPFGHGLSYTEFEYGDLTIAPRRIKPASTVEIGFRLTNRGKIEGEEVVQLYLRDEYSSLTRPIKELKGFKRVRLEPGESREVKFTLSTDLLAFYDREMNLVVEPGDFKVMVGGSSQDVRLEGDFELVGEKKTLPAPRRFFSEVELG